MHIKSYQQYLNKRSYKAFLYRKLFLYKILDYILIKPAIDIGCGIGDFVKISNKVTLGVDINTMLVTQCKKAGLNVKLIKSNKIPCSSESFNSVILDNVLEHILNPSKILIEIKRILKKKGVVLIGVPGLKGFKSDTDHKIYYTDNNIIPLLEKYSFKFKKKIILPIPLSFLQNILKIHCNYYIFIKS